MSKKRYRPLRTVIHNTHNGTIMENYYALTLCIVGACNTVAEALTAMGLTVYEREVK